jgi:DNA-binding MarR family transcriptional regulator
MNKYEILDYLRQHPTENNTIKLLSEKFNLTRHKTRSTLEILEYMKLVSREEKRVADCNGIERKTFVYLAIK